MASKLFTFWKIQSRFLKFLLFPFQGYGFILKAIFEYVKFMKLPAALIEGISIAPMFIVLIANFSLFESWNFLISDLNIDDWISLTRFKTHPLDRVWCDWCSIVNGVNEMIYHKIKTLDLNQLNDKFHEKKNGIIPLYLKYLMSLKYIPGTVYYEHSNDIVISIEQNEILERIIDPVVKDKVKNFLLFYNTVKLTEKRWCPFKYIKDIVNYDREYYCFNSDEENNLHIAGQILREYGLIENCQNMCTNEHITVHDYMTTINNSTAIIKTEYPSIFDEYMNLLRKK